MNFKDLENAWAGQSPAGQTPPVEELRQHLVDEIAQRRRRVSRVLAVITFVFVTGLAVEIVAHYTAIKAFNPVTFTASLVRAAFYCGALAVAVRSVRRMEREAAAMGGSVSACVRGSLGALEWQMRDCRLLLWALPVWLAGSALLMTANYFSGDLPGRGAAVGIAMSIVFAGAIAATVGRYYRRELSPRRDDLRGQLAALEKSD